MKSCKASTSWFAERRQVDVQASFDFTISPTLPILSFLTAEGSTDC
jgi:hypothetical protein